MVGATLLQLFALWIVRSLEVSVVFTSASFLILKACSIVVGSLCRHLRLWQWGYTFCGAFCQVLLGVLSAVHAEPQAYIHIGNVARDAEIGQVRAFYCRVDVEMVVCIVQLCAVSWQDAEWLLVLYMEMPVDPFCIGPAACRQVVFSRWVPTM